jgi:hypothetical protein
MNLISLYSYWCFPRYVSLNFELYITHGSVVTLWLVLISFHVLIFNISYIYPLIKIFTDLPIILHYFLRYSYSPPNFGVVYSNGENIILLLVCD